MKHILSITLLISSLLANVASASYLDEYKAQHPRQVKIERKLEPSGRTKTVTTVTLFKCYLADGQADGPFRFTFTDNDGIRLLNMTYANTTSSPSKFTEFSWGDGQNVHPIKRFISYSDHQGHHKYLNVITANIRPVELTGLKTAVVVSVHGGGSLSTPLLFPSRKRWKDWLKALDAAEKLMNDK